ncbi:MAG: peroxidase-related enzyme [Ectothiorhodospiraceae bacterium]|nr:peroxidase-related enzyme [Ectothiorhodospiraceae bacterium]
MSRISVVSPETANAEQKALFSAIQSQLGMVPNFLKVFANSPAALQAFLGLHGIAKAGSLDLQTRERIALALAEQNACEYCLSAHSALAKGAGLSPEEIAINRRGASQDAKAAAAVTFARALVEHTGEVTTTELQAVRDAGYGDAEIVEIITHVGLNLLTNILGKASRVEIDFDRVAVGSAA